MSMNDTICAIATPPGAGGIGIVRVSGNGAPIVLKKIWCGKKKVESFESHKMYLGRICDPNNALPLCKGEMEGVDHCLPSLTLPYKGRVQGRIDTALAVWMRAPSSYTGEDVVEISCHGGPTVLEQILNSCISAGARLAEPGEFTRRAFLNGKMDLAQAEAVCDLISATSGAASRTAKNQLEGRLSKEINGFLDDLTKLRAFVEASIDFPEEDIELIENEGIANRLAEIASKMRVLADSYSEGRLLRDGVRVAIVGKPNVGKSSLFNALVGHDRAIVHHTSGTTRDLVTETVQIGGIAFHLTDGAGIREGGHEVEKIGIEKAREAIEKADLVLFVVDGSQQIDKNDLEIYESLDLKRTIVCINKSDLLKAAPPLCKGRMGGVDLPPLSPPPRPGSGQAYKGGETMLSALRGDGVETLKSILVQKITGQRTIKTESVIITSARHKGALDQAAAEIENAIVAANERGSAEFIDHHLRQAHDFIGQITGSVGTEAVLDHIFSRFCIGK